MNRPRRTTESELVGHPVLFDDSFEDRLDGEAMESAVDKGSTYYDQLLHQGLTHQEIAAMNARLTETTAVTVSSAPAAEWGVATHLVDRMNAVSNLMDVLGEINEKVGAVEVADTPHHRRHGYIMNRIHGMESKLPFLQEQRDIIMSKLMASEALRAVGFTDTEIQIARDHLELRRLAASQKHGKGHRVRARQKKLVTDSAMRASSVDQQ